MEIIFTPTSEGAKLTPPEPLKLNFPDWYRGMSVFNSNADQDSVLRMSGDFTIKKCTPIMDYLKSGYLLKFTTDIYINPERDGDIQSFGWKIPHAMNIVNSQHHDMFPIMINGAKKHYVKFDSEYTIQTPSGYSCVVFQPQLHFENRFEFISGIIDTDQFDGNIKAIGWINETKLFKIEMGTPMIAVFPFKRDDWKMKLNDQVGDVEKNITSNLMKRKFYNFYHKYFHKPKKYE